jgi:molecular chaperone DnaJ
MDFYLVLGLPRQATLGDVKRAFRRLARKYHPDINPGDRLAAAQFRRIAEAYETLSDPDRRHRYDSAGDVNEGQPHQAFGFEGFDFSAAAPANEESTFGELFADILRPPEPSDSGGPVRGADVHLGLALGFEEALRGAQRAVTITRQVPCRVCAGAGRLHTEGARCVHCHGTGTLRSARGHMVFAKPCGYCRGSGEQAEALCAACGGHRMGLRSESVLANVPAGLSDGARIRVPGKGHTGRGGGEAGDLLITVRVEPHPVFRREGDDLHAVVPVAIHEAALGARVEIAVLDGPARLRVPPGSQSGQRFRLRERGAVSPRDGKRGDLVLEIVLVLPPVLDERSKELLREFGRINSADVRRDVPTGVR